MKTKKYRKIQKNKKIKNNNIFLIGGIPETYKTTGKKNKYNIYFEPILSLEEQILLEKWIIDNKDITFNAPVELEMILDNFEEFSNKRYTRDAYEDKIFNLWKNNNNITYLILYNNDKQQSLIDNYNFFRKNKETDFLKTLNEEDQRLIMEWKENNNLQYVNENDLEEAINESFVKIDEDFIPEDDEYK
jgi:hypothetical protein